MPKFKFDLADPKPVLDQAGLIFRDCSVAGRAAEELAADLGRVRPDLCGRASVGMSDENRSEITYRVAIGPPRAVVNRPINLRTQRILN
jgi:hypothetical protein